MLPQATCLERRIELNRTAKRISHVVFALVLASPLTARATLLDQELNLLVGLAVGQAGGQPADSEQAGQAASTDEVDGLLASARDAMGQGNYQAAEAILRRAESVQVQYPMLHFGDTPTKVRRDLEKLRGERQHSNGQPEKPRRTLAGRLNSMGAENPAGETAAIDPFLAAHRPTRNKASANLNPFLDNSSAISLGEPGSSPRTTDSLPRYQLPPSLAGPVSPTVEPSTATARQQSDQALHAARRALATGDLQQAQKHLHSARQLGVAYDETADSPDRVDESIRDYQAFSDSESGSLEQRVADPSWRLSYAKFLMEQARALVEWNDWEAAQKAASEAQQMNVRFAAGTTTPSDLLRLIDQRRNPASSVIRTAAQTPVQGSATPADSLVLAAPLPSASAATAEEVQVAQALNSVPTPLPVPTSTTKEKSISNARAETDLSSTIPDSLLKAGPLQLLQAGEQALRKGDRQRALDLFRGAHADSKQLDIQSQQRLQDHLQMLATSLSGCCRTAQPGKSVVDRQGGRGAGGPGPTAFGRCRTASVGGCQTPRQGPEQVPGAAA